MTEEELIKKSYEALARYQKRPAKEQLQKLIDQGVIDEEGKMKPRKYPGSHEIALKEESRLAT